MKFSEYLRNVRNSFERNPNLRKGQVYFNELYLIMPQLANRIRGTSNDPFHNDSNLNNFFQYICTEFDDEEKTK